MALKENDLKFFRPLWIRVAVTAVLAVWCALEMIYTHEELWIGVTGFGVAYCLWNFFWKWPKDLPAAAGPASAPEITAPPAESQASEPPKQP